MNGGKQYDIIITNPIDIVYMLPAMHTSIVILYLIYILYTNIIISSLYIDIWSNTCSCMRWFILTVIHIDNIRTVI